MKKNILILIGALIFCVQGVPSFASDAATVYKMCVACHGKDGKGNPAMAKIFKVKPADLDLKDKVTLSKSDADLSKIISDGKNKMPAYKGKLTVEEINVLVAYLRGTPVGATVAKHKTLAENSVFKAKCSACHGKDGKGNPSMAKMFKVEPAELDLTDKETLSKSDEDLSKITSDGKGKMPAFKGKLKNEEIVSLVAYLHTLAPVTKAAVSEVVESTSSKIQESSTTVESVPETHSDGGEGEKN